MAGVGVEGIEKNENSVIKRLVVDYFEIEDKGQRAISCI